MEYALAKKLKESGFPQRGEKGVFATPSMDTFLHSFDKPYGLQEAGVFANHVSLEEVVYIPTINELIDSLGDKELNFYRYRLEDGRLMWCAAFQIDGVTQNCEDYPNLEEALVRLYLRLNE